MQNLLEILNWHKKKRKKNPNDTGQTGSRMAGSLTDTCLGGARTDRLAEPVTRWQLTGRTTD